MTGPENWNTINVPPPVRSKVGDLTQFGKIRTPSMGVSATTSTGFGPSGVFSKRGKEDKGDSPVNRQNAFAALASQTDDVPESTDAPVSQRPRLMLAPRTVPMEADEKVAEPEVEVKPAAVDREAIARSIKNSVDEWFDIRHVGEATEAFKSLPEEARPELVTALATKGMQKKEDDVRLLATLFAAVAGDMIPSDGFIPALRPVIVDLDDTASDVRWRRREVVQHADGLTCTGSQGLPLCGHFVAIGQACGP